MGVDRTGVDGERERVPYSQNQIETFHVTIFQNYWELRRHSKVAKGNPYSMQYYLWYIVKPGPKHGPVSRIAKGKWEKILCWQLGFSVASDKEASVFLICSFNIIFRYGGSCTGHVYCMQGVGRCSQLIWKTVFVTDRGGGGGGGVNGPVCW